MHQTTFIKIQQLSIVEPDIMEFSSLMNAYFTNDTYLAIFMTIESASCKSVLRFFYDLLNISNIFNIIGPTTKFG